MLCFLVTIVLRFTILSYYWWEPHFYSCILLVWLGVSRFYRLWLTKCSNCMCICVLCVYVCVYLQWGGGVCFSTNFSFLIWLLVKMIVIFLKGRGEELWNDRIFLTWFFSVQPEGLLTLLLRKAISYREIQLQVRKWERYNYVFHSMAGENCVSQWFGKYFK